MGGLPPIRKDMEGLLQDHQERLDLLERRLARASTTISVPSGGLAPFAGGTVPAGWLLCDGAAVSRTTYPGLFAAIGTAWGAGDGSTTFNVPNLKGRALVGRDAAQTEFNTLAKTGGAKTHTLTIAEMPSHSHQWNAAGTNNPGGVPQNWDDIVAANTSPLGVGPAAPENAGANAIAARGGSGAHNNLQPYAVVNWIIAAS